MQIAFLPCEIKFMILRKRVKLHDTGEVSFKKSRPRHVLFDIGIEIDFILAMETVAYWRPKNDVNR
jgi:hypothetical protein